MRRQTLLRRFGARVRLLREGKGMSQESLGERAGLHRNYVGGIERGEYNATILSLAKLSRALGVTPSELLKGVEP